MKQESRVQVAVGSKQVQSSGRCCRLLQQYYIDSIHVKYLGFQILVAKKEDVNKLIITLLTG